MGDQSNLFADPEAIAKLRVFLEEVQNPPLDAEGFAHGQKYRYASLRSVLSTVREAASKAGIVVLQKVESEPLSPEHYPAGSVLVDVLTSLIDGETGQMLTDSSVQMVVLPTDKTAQALGAIITYLRRYALLTIAGIVGEPDMDAGTGEGERVPGDQSSRRAVANVADSLEQILQKPRPWSGEDIVVVLRSTAARYAAKARALGRQDGVAEWVNAALEMHMAEVVQCVFGHASPSDVEVGVLAKWLGFGNDHPPAKIREEIENLFGYCAEQREKNGG